MPKRAKSNQPWCQNPMKPFNSINYVCPVIIFIDFDSFKVQLLQRLCIPSMVFGGIYMQVHLVAIYHIYHMAKTPWYIITFKTKHSLSLETRFTGFNRRIFTFNVKYESVRILSSKYKHLCIIQLNSSCGHAFNEISAIYGQWLPFLLADDSSIGYLVFITDKLSSWACV